MTWLEEFGFAIVIEDEVQILTELCEKNSVISAFYNLSAKSK
jgi:hypothetical protein